MSTTEAPPGVQLVTLTIDGQEVSVPKGTNVIEAARKIGIDIPYLCYHHQLTSFGGCRLCGAAQFSGMAASSGGSLKARLISIMSNERAMPIDLPRFALLFAAAILTGYGRIAAGIVTGAIREATYSGPITFDAIHLRPSQTDWRSAEFDPVAGQLSLKNVSLRQLISMAYPSSLVNSEPELIDRVHYDIEARWHEAGATSERNVYRELLTSILRSNSNLQLYVTKR